MHRRSLFFRFFVFLFVISFSLMSISCKSEKINFDIRERQPEEIESSDYTKPERCGGCHDEIFRQWKGSIHSNAYRDPVFQKVYQLAEKETGGAMGEFCISCHSPVGYLSYEIPPADGSKLSTIARRGVFCDFCHTLSKQNGIGDFQIEVLPGQIKRGPFKDSESPWHETAFSELHTKAEFCGSCHNVNHPVNGLELEKTYTEWKKGPYSKEGIQCQDCHMTPGHQVTSPNPGKAATMGPEREHIFTHEFVGGNAFVSGILDSDKHKELAEERLKSVAKLKVTSSKALTPGEKEVVSIQVENVGCGHYFPTGLTEIRELWLEVKVVDGDDKVIFSSPGLDKKGDLKKGARLFNTVVVDKEGKPTLKVWEAEKIKKDKRIPPKDSVIEEFDIKIPKDADTPFTIDASLKYRTLPQGLADELFGKGKYKVPIIEMSRIEVFR